MGASAQGGVQPYNYQGGNDVFSNASSGLNQAMQGTQQGMSYQPMNVQAGQGQAALVGGAPMVNAQNVQAGQIASTNLGAYTNPYESQVVQNSLNDIERARQMQANQLAAQASAAGAFGGSRAALMQSELGRNSLNQAAQTAAQLRQAGFQNAQQLAGQDIGYGLQANLANQGANLQAGTTNAQLRQAANLANQGAYNNMTQFNLGNQMTAQQLNQAAGLQGAQQRLGAASQMGNLANLGFGMGQQTQAMQQQSGTIAQAINQALIDAAKGQFGGFTGAPAQSLGYMASALGATPASSTTTNSRNPGLFDYLTLGATALGGK